MPNPLSIFLSSCCYDLIDLRAEVATCLEADGNLVYRSEDPDSSFANRLDARDSIEACLLNIDRCDVVVCIVDRRYGPLLQGEYGDFSATHIEIKHAREVGKPILTFIRDQAYREFKLIQKSRHQSDMPSEHLKWILPESEKEDKRVRQRYVEMISELTSLQNGKNWFDPFRTSVDLASIIRKRLIENFPYSYQIAAMGRDRFLRLSFRRDNAGAWHLKNPNAQPVFDIYISTSPNLPNVPIIWTHGLYLGCLAAFGEVQVTRGVSVSVMCQYQNAAGDVFRVYQGTPEEIYVRQPGPAIRDGDGAERPTNRWLRLQSGGQSSPDHGREMTDSVLQMLNEDPELLSGGEPQDDP